jgi:hypothetical protein
MTRPGTDLSPEPLDEGDDLRRRVQPGAVAENGDIIVGRGITAP